MTYRNYDIPFLGVAAILCKSMFNLVSESEEGADRGQKASAVLS